MVDMVRLAPYYLAFNDFKCKIILDMEDVLSKRYRRQLECKTLKANYMGAYAEHFGTLQNKILNGRLLKNIILKLESYLMEKAEKCYASKIYGSTILVSESEAQYLNRVIGASRAVTVTLGCDYEFLSKPMEVVKTPFSMLIVWNIGKFRFLGNDLQAVIRSTQLFLSPMAYGSGIKTKIKETMR